MYEDIHIHFYLQCVYRNFKSYCIKNLFKEIFKEKFKKIKCEKFEKIYKIT